MALTKASFVGSGIHNETGIGNMALTKASFVGVGSKKETGIGKHGPTGHQLHGSGLGGTCQGSGGNDPPRHLYRGLRLQRGPSRQRRSTVLDILRRAL
jgi:hypothetical protein